MIPTNQNDAVPPPGARFILAHELPASYLHQVLHMTAELALMHDIKYVVVGWYSDLGFGQSGVHLCIDGCLDGAYGTYTVYTDLDYIEAQANVHPFADEHALVIQRRDGRSAIVIRGDENTRKPW